MLTLFLSYGHHFLSLVLNAIFDFLGVSSPNSHQLKSTLTCKLSVGPLTLKIQSRSKKDAMAIWPLSVKVVCNGVSLSASAVLIWKMFFGTLLVKLIATPY